VSHCAYSVVRLPEYIAAGQDRSILFRGASRPQAPETWVSLTFDEEQEAT